MSMLDEQREKKTFIPPLPDVVLNLTEKSLGLKCTNLFRPLNSYINRVYELLGVDDEQLIIKFYRPGRWSKEALQEEHRFLVELKEKEMPVIAPLNLVNGETLGEYENFLFAIFPKFGGRSNDEFSDDQWLELGRLLARVHSVGERFNGSNRPVMLPVESTRKQQQFLLESDLISKEMVADFIEVTDQMIEETSPLFEGTEMIHIHGDCHFSNILQRPGESLTLIDFDDMVLGTPVQDLWMLLPDVAENCFVEIDLFLEGYETFRPFDRKTIGLIEPLRAMRYVHYMAWCAYQAKEDGNVQVMENFGSREYWRCEIDDLRDLLGSIRKNASQSIGFGGNCA